MSGEKAFNMDQIDLSPIGIIRTPHKSREGTPIQPSGARDIIGRVELDPAFQDGLKDLEGFSHLFLLYFFHLSEGYDLSVQPFLDRTTHGIFATRAPRRPNAIGISIVRLLSIENGVLFVEGADMVDGTPLLDIKPFVPDFDIPDGPIRTGWLEKNSNNVHKTRADKRFL